MNSPSRPFVLATVLPMLTVLMAACGGPGQPTPTALPPDLVRADQPTPVFDNPADRFSLRTPEITPAAAAVPVIGEVRGAQSSSVRPTVYPPLYQPPSALAIVRYGGALRSAPAGPVLLSLPAGTTLTVTGRSADGRALAAFTSSGQIGWIGTREVILYGADDLTVLDEPVQMGAIATLIAQAMQPVELPTPTVENMPRGQQSP